MKIIIIGGVTVGMSAVSKITGGSRAEVVVYEKGIICSCGTYELLCYLANRGADIRQTMAIMEETLRTPGVTVHCRHEVLSAACGRKQVTVRDLDSSQVFDDHHDKLVIAVGSHNLIPNMSGVEKVGAQVLKTVEDVIFLREFIRTPFVHDITTVGGSFVGLELAKAFLKMSRSVRIIKKEDQLSPTFNTEVSIMIQQESEESSVKIHLRETLRGFTGGTFVEKTETSCGSYGANSVVMAVGVALNTGCLIGSDISMTPQRKIIIDKSMETNVPDVYIVGDRTCSLEGSLQTSSSKMADLEIARTGLTEQKAEERGGIGSRVRVALMTANNQPGFCPNANQITAKTIYDGASGQILGVQVWGEKNVTARVNMFAVTIGSDMMPEQLGNVDFSYSLTVSSIWGPVQVVCHNAKQAGGNHMGRTDAVGLSFFGKSATHQLPAKLKKMGIHRVLVVTDRFLYGTGVVRRMGRALLEGNTEYVIYYQVRPSPIVRVVNECLMATRTLEMDMLVAVGGGSAIDTAKAVSITIANSGSTEDYEGTGKSACSGIPTVAVNTTAGTGSKVASFYATADTKKHSKVAMVDANCTVRVAISDISFMMSIPSRLMASTGMDALTHTLGAALSVRATPFTDKDALWAIGTICGNLPKTVSDGGDEEAGIMTTHVEYATGMALSNAGLGMVHAIIHAPGGHYNLSHSTCSAVLLPYVLEYNGTVPEAWTRPEKVAKAMRLKTAVDQTTAAYGSSPGAQTVSTVIETIRQLSRQVGIPQGLSPLEPVRTKDFRILAELAMKDTCMAGNTVRPTLQEVVQVYHHAHQGR